MSRADNVSGGKRADGLDSTYNDYVKIRKTTLLDSATTGRTLTFPDRDDTVATLTDINLGATLAGTNVFSALQTYNAGTVTNGGATFYSTVGGPLTIGSLNSGLPKCTIDTFGGGSDIIVSLPETNGVLALTSDIPSPATYAQLANIQSFTALQTFTAGIRTDSILGSAATFTVPSSGSADTIALLSTAQLFNNKGFFPGCYWRSVADSTKRVSWNTVNSITSTTLTLNTQQTTTQNLFIPDITTTDIIATLRVPQTFEASNNFISTASFTGISGLATSGSYPRTSASNQQSSTFTTPAIALGGTNDGLYSSGADIVDFGAQGTNYISLQPQGIYRFVGGTIDPAIVFNQRIQALNGASGATSPAIQFDNQNSGFYRVSQGVLGIGISGVATGRWSSTGLNLFGVGGSAGAPAINLLNETTSGIYRPAANEVAVSCSGTQRLKCSASGINVTGSTVSSTPVACEMRRSTSQTITTGSTVTLVSYDSSSNPSGYFSLNTTTGIITITVTDAPFMLMMFGQIQYTQSIVGVRELWIEETGSGARWVDANRNACSDAGDTSKFVISGCRMITTNGTYTMAMKTYHNVGSNTTVGGGSLMQTTFSLFRVC